MEENENDYYAQEFFIHNIDLYFLGWHGVHRNVFLNSSVSPRMLSSTEGLPVMTFLHVWQRSISGFPSLIPAASHCWVFASSSALAWQVSQIM